MGKLYSGAEPEFIEGDIFKIIIPLTTGAMTKVGPGTDIETNTETNTETSTEITDASISAKISAVERDIRRLIGEDPHITIDQMVEKTNWSKGGIRYQIDKMKKAGKLSREGSQKDGKWVIKQTIREVNLGDDTDTVGAVAGGLAGLAYGYGSIPAECVFCNHFLDKGVEHGLEKFKSNLKELRLAAGLTLDELADETGIDKRTIITIENEADANPSVGTVKPYTEIFRNYL